MLMLGLARSGDDYRVVGGKKLELDLPMLVDTRLLIQANSGGGKSWLRLYRRTRRHSDDRPGQWGLVRESTWCGGCEGKA